MMAADCLEELGIKRGESWDVIKVNNRKVLDGLDGRPSVAGGDLQGDVLNIRIQGSLDRDPHRSQSRPQSARAPGL